MVRILHISYENKFLDHAEKQFEFAYPGQNTYWVVKDKSAKYNFLNPNHTPILTWSLFNPYYISQLKKFDVVFIHRLRLSYFLLIFFASKKVKFCWIGWGIDYYNFIYRDYDDLLLSKTKELKKSLHKDDLKKNLLQKRCIDFLKLVLYRTLKSYVYKRINTFAPVLYKEYDMMRDADLIPFLPKYVQWNYGAVNALLLRTSQNKSVTGNSVLVGNSSEYINNHLEILDDLKSILPPEKPSISIILPLSYGDEKYGDFIADCGHKYFGSSIEVLRDYMSMEEYTRVIMRCGFVIMNHRRQAALGNIASMMFLGARVFLRSDNPVYQMLRKNGAVINTIDELKRNPILLKQRLNECQIRHNKEVLLRLFSFDQCIENTKKIVGCSESDCFD